MADLADTPFREPSLGEQHLILLVRALVPDPVVLIVDEVCQSLPADARAAVLSALDRLCRHEPPLSLLCVSHHWDEIPDSVAHVLHLSDGRVASVAYGLPKTRR